MKRVKIALLNSIASFVQYAVKIIVQFLLVPILVTGLGEALYGAWLILIRSVGFISAADGRPTQALKWVIANEQLSDEHQLKRKAIGSALGVAFLMMPLMAFLGFTVAWFAPHLTGIGQEHDTIMRVVSAILVFNLMLTVLVMLPESVIHGMNMSYKRMGLVSLVDITGGLLVFLLISYGAGIIGVASALMVQTSLSGILFLILAKKYLPWFGFEKVSYLEIRKFFNISVWYSGWNLAQRILISSDVVIIGVLMSAVLVTDYTLTAYISTTLVTALSMVVAAATPGLGGLIGNKEYSKALNLHREMLLLSLLLIAAFGVTILIWNHSLVAMWVGADHYVGDGINLLMVILAMQLLLMRNDAYLIDATLDIKKKVKMGFVASIVMVISSAVLGQKYGLIGICIGLFLGRSILNFAYPVIICKFLGGDILEHYKTMVLPFVVVLSLFMMVFLVGPAPVVESWFHLSLFAILTVFVVMVLVFFIGFSRAHRNQIYNRYKSFRGTKKLGRVGNG